MAIEKDLAAARKRQKFTQEQLSLDLSISRESLAKYETKARRLPPDMRKPIAEAIDDEEYYFATWTDAAGDVSIPYLDGENIDQHPSSMVFLVKREMDDAMEQLKMVCWSKPAHAFTDSDKEEISRLLFELLDASASIINLVAVICREYGFSMKKIFRQWKISLKARGLLKNEN